MTLRPPRAWGSQNTPFVLATGKLYRVARIYCEEVSLFSCNLRYNCKERARRPFGRPWNDTVMYIYAWRCRSRPRDRCVRNAVKWGAWALVWVRWNEFLSNTAPLAAVFEDKSVLASKLYPTAFHVHHFDTIHWHYRRSMCERACFRFRRLSVYVAFRWLVDWVHGPAMSACNQPRCKMYFAKSFNFPERPIAPDVNPSSDRSYALIPQVPISGRQFFSRPPIPCSCIITQNVPKIPSQSCPVFADGNARCSCSANSSSFHCSHWFPLPTADGKAVHPDREQDGSGWWWHERAPDKAVSLFFIEKKVL